MPTCFIAMPISTADPSQYNGDSDHFRHVLDHLFAPAITEAGFVPLPPKATGTEVIHAEIVAQLESADLVLCDVSGLNANVFFELGIRTARNKPICLVKDELTRHIPFDTTLLNHHTYRSSLAPWHLEQEISTLAEHVRVSMEKSGGGNGLWKHFGLSIVAPPAETTSDADTKLTLLAQQIQVLSQRLTTLPPDPLAAYGISETAHEQANRVVRHMQEVLRTYGVVSNGATWGDGTLRLTVDKIPHAEVAALLAPVARAIGNKLAFSLAEAARDENKQ